MRKTDPNFTITHYWKVDGEKRLINGTDFIYLDGFGIDSSGKSHAFEYLGECSEPYI